jgi:stress-induced morphogen
MATVLRGVQDEIVNHVKSTLDEYERQFAGSEASLYRQNPASIRIRIVDDRFGGRSKGERHDEVWDFIASRLDQDEMQDISFLLPLTSAELDSSLINLEFDAPTPSRL